MLAVHEDAGAHTPADHGLDLLVSGNYAAALRFFGEALSQDETAEFWNGWGSAHAALGHLAEAVEGFGRAHHLDTGNNVIIANLGAVRQSLAQYRAESQYAGNTQIHEQLHANALAQFQQRRIREAIVAMRQLLALTDNSRFWNDFGTLHVGAGNDIDAEVAYSRAIELDSTNQRALTNLVLLLERNGRHTKAAQWKEKTNPAELVRERALARQQQAGATLQSATVQELMEAVAELPSYAKDTPASMRSALLVNRSDSSYFVESACRLLASFADEIKVEVTRSMASSDYRMYLVLARFNLDCGDYNAALPLIQKACDANPADLYADRLLDRCMQHQTGNENATNEYLATRFCEAPWRHFEISGEGQVFFCCPAWMTVPAGQMGHGSAEEIWNSVPAQELRNSILDGSFRYCSRIHCPQISARTLPARDLYPADLLAAQYPAKAQTMPAMVSLAYDKTCNLACPQCRTDFIVAKPAERGVMDTYVPAILDLARTAEVLYMNGAGEVFGSRHTRELLRRVTREEFPDLKFYLISNANLFDRRAYDEFDLRGRIQKIDISIDAATGETYAWVRKGGNFARLLRNLEFLDHLRRDEGEEFEMELRYVVSGPNYREMPAFVELGRSIHADRICFTRFRNWGTFSEAEFNRMNITDPAHPEHREFLQVLQDVRLEDPIVDLGSVAPFKSGAAI